MDGAARMTRYTIKDGKPFGYDDSQNELYENRIASEGHVPATKADVDALNPVTLHELASAAMALVNAEYTKRMGAIADAYPLHERESWPVQLQEARMVMDYVDANVPVPETIRAPWIDQCAAQRGLTREDLAARIVVKDAGYRQISGFLSGVRQKHEDEISTLLAAGEESREALQNYWYLEGWEVDQEEVVEEVT